MFPRTDCESFHRRDFLTVGSAGMLGLTLPGILAAEAKANAAPPVAGKKKAQSVILVWLAGGPATIDMWDPKPDAPEGIRGEFKDMPTAVPGLRLAEHLPKMAAVADKVSVVRSLYHTIPSHGPATVFMTTGNKPTAALNYPSMGSLAAKLLKVETGIPPNVSFTDLRGGAAGGAGYLGSGYNPFGVETSGGNANAKPGSPPANFRIRGITLPNNLTLADLEKRDKLLRSFDDAFRKVDQKNDLIDGLDTFHQQALDILRSDKTKAAFDLAKEPAATRDRFGPSPFGQSALAARRLVEAGVRFVTVGIGGWDTHSQNFNALKTRLLPPVDTVLSALVADLDQRGLLDSTIVMCAGEFGRTPKVNKNAGRDHWARSMACVLAGGGIKRGYVHGTTDPQGMAPDKDPCTPDDLAATIFQQLGIPATTELQTPTGRPVQLFRDGKVVEKLIG